MDKSSLVVIARMRAKPGKESELRKALIGLVEPTRQEQGCIKYDLHESLESPGLFFFYEIWVNEQALSAHFKTPHIVRMQDKAPFLLAEPLELHKLSWVGQQNSYSSVLKA